MKKLLCILLAMLMLLPLCVACGNDEQPPVDTGDNVSDSADTSDTTPASPVRTHDIPEGTSFGSEEYLAVTMEWQGYKYYFFADEESSDTMQSAIYNRRRAIEEELDVKLTHFFYESFAVMNKAIEQDVSVGHTEIDTALMHCINGNASFSANGYLYPLEQLKYVDLEADWWNLTQMDSLRASKHYYFGVNDFMIPCPYVIFFNKDMVENMDGMPNPYELVLADKWTFDVFEEMARAATIDLNTDGVFDAQNDSFGIFIGEESKYCSFWSAFDQSATAKDEDGRIVLNMNSEKTADIIERFADLVKSNVTLNNFGENVVSDLTMDAGRMLFTFEPIAYAERFRDCEVEIGMLPYPKYDEAQDSYYSLDWGGLMCAPNCISNPDLVGAVLELLAFKSSEEVIPTYYEVVLDGQLARDPDTVKMLDVIFESVCYDPGMNFWGLSSPFMQLFFVISHHVVARGVSDWSSMYAKYGQATQNQIDSYYQTLELYEDFNAALD